MAVDKFRSDSPPRLKIHFPIKHKAGVGSRSFRQSENRYDSVMRFAARLLFPLTLLLALAGTAPVAWAQAQSEPQRQEPRPEPPSRPAMPARNPESLSDSVRRAQRESGGQILGAERVQYDGREINRVKVMDNSGRVRYMDSEPDRRGDRGARRPQREDAPPPRARGDNPPRP